MKNSYITREMSIDDYEKVIEIWENSEGIRLGDSDSKENIAHYLRHNPGMSFVTEFENNVVGAVLCGHDTRRGYLHHLAVNKNHRNKGIGKELVKKCLEQLKKIGIKKCHVFVLVNNQTGIDFWKNIGWELRTDIHILSKNV